MVTAGSLHERAIASLVSLIGYAQDRGWQGAVVLSWGRPVPGREGSGARAGRGAGVAADVTEPGADLGLVIPGPGRDAPCYSVLFPG
jgi:hypothetical protein